MHRPQATGKRIPITQWCKSMLAVCIGIRDEEPQTNSRTIDTPSELFASLERYEVRRTVRATVGQTVFSLCEDTGHVISHQITRVEGDQAFYSVRLDGSEHLLPAYEDEYFTSLGALVAGKRGWIDEEIEACEDIAKNLRRIRDGSPLDIPVVKDPASPTDANH
jgi:hypothetical protein